MSNPVLQAGSPLTIELDVKNLSKKAGDEVLELYLNFPNVAGAPRVALRGFTRVHVEAGELRHVKLSMAPRDLSYVNESGDRLVAAGDYVITVGGGQPGTGAAHAETHLSIQGEQKLPE